MRCAMQCIITEQQSMEYDCTTLHFKAVQVEKPADLLAELVTLIHLQCCKESKYLKGRYQSCGAE